MNRIYSAQVAEPFTPTSAGQIGPDRALVAWSPNGDLAAVVSGCGGVAVFHADSPENVTVVRGNKHSRAQHVVWRPSLNKPPMLVVGDTLGTIFFWTTDSQETNKWFLADSFRGPSVSLAIGWNATSTAIATLLKHGGLAVWLVPDNPSSRQDRTLQSVEGRSGDDAIEPGCTNSIQYARCKDPLILESFSHPMRFGVVEAGYVDPYGFAVLTVNDMQPNKLSLWSVSTSKHPHPSFKVKFMAQTTVHTQAERCLSCAISPRGGLLYVIDDRRFITCWRLRYQRVAARTYWALECRAQIDTAADEAVLQKHIPPFSTSVSQNDTEALDNSQDGQVLAFDTSSDSYRLISSSSHGLFYWHGRKLEIIDGYHFENESPSLHQERVRHRNSYVGVRISPDGSSVLALRRNGCVHRFSLPNAESSVDARR